MELRSLRERLKMRVAAELDLTRDVEDAEIARMIDRCILEETKDQYVPLKEKVGLRVELFNSLRRLDVLTELLEDETVTEIMVNGQSDIFVERDGVIRRYEKGFSSEERLETVIQHIVGDCNRRINAASPIVDARPSPTLKRSFQACPHACMYRDKTGVAWWTGDHDPAVSETTD